MKKTKVAVIGAGRWGKNIIKTLCSLEKVTLLNIAYNSGNKTKVFLNEHYPDIPTTTNYKNILNDSEVDCVCIATPIDTHTEIVRESLLAGKHVFVEKPLSNKKDSAEELHELAEKNNLVLFTGYQYLFDGQLEEIREAIQKKPNGWKIKTIWEKWGTFDAPIHTNLLVHDIALATHLLGEPKKVISKSKYTLDSDSIKLELEHPVGTSSIFIDRSVQGKKIRSTTVSNGDENYTFSPSSNLLNMELSLFLEEVNGKKESVHHRQIDLAVADTLSQVLQ